MVLSTFISRLGVEVTLSTIPSETPRFIGAIESLDERSIIGPVPLPGPREGVIPLWTPPISDF